ncbi:CPBP family intramembrane glutamic endopeptidase [Desulfocicer vacuolatum]|nr:type II CAAX endopeptidase family protein [Desulfocicer vacuolatum]
MSVVTIMVLESGGATLLSLFFQIPELVMLTLLRVLEITCLLAIVHGFGQGLLCVGLAGEQLMGGLLQGAWWSLIFGFVALAGAVLLLIMGLNPLVLLHVPLPGTVGLRVLFLITGCLIGPLAEEIFFRGILYGFFRQWGVWFALSATTFLFVVMHSPRAGLPVPQMVGSIVFTLAYEKRGELAAPVIIHCLGNFALLGISLIPG